MRRSSRCFLFKVNCDMSEIRYWELGVDNNIKLNIDNKQQNKMERNSYKAFEAMMMSQMIDDPVNSGSNRFLVPTPSTNFMFADSTETNSYVNNLLSNNSISESLISNNIELEGRLKNLQNQGMEKVWAAQLSNPLPNFGHGLSDKDHNSSMSSLDTMISLTVKEQMMRAQQVLAQQSQEFEGVGLVEEGSHQSIADFGAFLQQQISLASEKYNLTEEEMRLKIEPYL